MSVQWRRFNKVGNKRRVVKILFHKVTQWCCRLEIVFSGQGEWRGKLKSLFICEHAKGTRNKRSGIGGRTDETVGLPWVVRWSSGKQINFFLVRKSKLSVHFVIALKRLKNDSITKSNGLCTVSAVASWSLSFIYRFCFPKKRLPFQIKGIF